MVAEAPLMPKESTDEIYGVHARKVEVCEAFGVAEMGGGLGAPPPFLLRACRLRRTTSPGAHPHMPAMSQFFCNTDPYTDTPRQQPFAGDLTGDDGIDLAGRVLKWSVLDKCINYEPSMGQKYTEVGGRPADERLWAGGANAGGGGVRSARLCHMLPASCASSGIELVGFDDPFGPPSMTLQGHEYKSDSIFKGLHAALQAMFRRANMVRAAQGKPPRPTDLLQDVTYKDIYRQCKTMFSKR